MESQDFGNDLFRSKKLVKWLFTKFYHYPITPYPSPSPPPHCVTPIIFVAVHDGASPFSAKSLSFSAPISLASMMGGIPLVQSRRPGPPDPIFRRRFHLYKNLTLSYKQI